MTVLLLNASYEPLSVIPLRRAVSLMLRERVDAVSAEFIALQTISNQFEVPHVLRLRKYVNVPRRGAHWSRRGLMVRDRYTCIYCGIRVGEKRGSKELTKRDFSIDHILPKSRGGKNSWVNTACACSKCNNRKNNRLPHEAGMKLRWEPRTPRVDYLVASGNIPDSWKIYLPIK